MTHAAFTLHANRIIPTHRSGNWKLALVLSDCQTEGTGYTPQDGIGGSSSTCEGYMPVPASMVGSNTGSCANRSSSCVCKRHTRVSDGEAMQPMDATMGVRCLRACVPLSQKRRNPHM